ncbi:LCP family protein [Lysinibacillus odysseyi]|uniref:Regulatory protein MsrR n=1 Tax=Lysinibacillus odysseyi 34hs-1 = NBRC 100172 TaxID=1220589 RepID=A0A0A3J4A2_9BACI|nr:LCP family protein [Lysinibacillus odysseyi]KGR81872.1 transcriptional regulator [Lysinibacillus odysseyi 34hs-1 = NBRC 100172]
MEDQNQRRYKKRKMRKGRVFLTVLLLLVLAVGFYGYSQYKAGLKLAGDAKPSGEVEDFVPDEKDGETVNYLLLGIDTRGEEQSRSDTMMLVSWQKKTDEIKLVSFMRDIYADIPDYGHYKLNTAYYLGGVQLAKDTITQMFDVPIHHYALIDFKSFESLIDIMAPDGVEMDVEKDMSAHIGVNLTQGQHKLNGQELLGYARFRHDAEGDFGRVARQQKVIEALKNELLSVGNTKNLPKLVGAAQGYVTTDVTSKDQLKTVLSMAVSGVDVTKMTIPAEGTYSDQRVSGLGLVLAIDQETNKQLLRDFLEGK